jgi:hypothetical protein
MLVEEKRFIDIHGTGGIYSMFFCRYHEEIWADTKFLPFAKG